MPGTEDDSLQITDVAPTRDRFEDDVLNGHQKVPKQLPCKYFYDERGSKLFDRICELEEYYPTRTEIGIMERYASAMAESIGDGAVVVEYGSGSSQKTRLLLEHLEEPAGYVPVDISREHLLRSAGALSADHPGLPVHPVCADFTQSFDLPTEVRGREPRVAYFPGSTIGNFAPREAGKFLGQIGDLCGSGGALLIGVDLKKDVEVLERAYNDGEGVTAAFNLNLLERINRELGGDFDIDRFAHRAFYNEDAGRVEMHLVSREAQTVSIGEEEIRFTRDESIHTESSYKYSLDDFAELARSASFEVEQVWTDPERLFSVQYLLAQ